MSNPPVLLARDDLYEWVQHALPNQRALYYTGRLWLARAHRPPLLSADQELLAQACCSLYNSGYAHLFQQRQFPYEHRHYLVVRSVKRIGAHAHATGALRRIIFNVIDALSAEGKRCVPGQYVPEAGEGTGKGNGREPSPARVRSPERARRLAAQGGQEGEGRGEEAEAFLAEDTAIRAADLWD